MSHNYLHSEITSKIIRAYFNVYNRLGYGFLEKVYKKALLIELKKLNLPCIENSGVQVYYDRIPVGIYYSDILVDNCVIVELKAVECLRPQHDAQIINYLKATDIEVGLLLNFGKSPEFRRKVLLRDYKS